MEERPDWLEACLTLWSLRNHRNHRIADAVDGTAAAPPGGSDSVTGNV